MGASRLVFAIGIAAACASPVRAQDPALDAMRSDSVAAVVEQVAATDIYLGVAAPVDIAPGAAVRITLRGRAADGVLLARAGTRLVVRMLNDGALPVVGDTVRLRFMPGAGQADSVRAVPSSPVDPVRPIRPVDPSGRASLRPPVDVSGRIGLSAHTIHSAGRWPEGELPWTRTDATPAARAYLRIEHLPGGLLFTASARGDRRFDLEHGTTGDPLVRVYEAHVERRFEAFPLHVRAGRFRNPYEPYGDPLDGALLRLAAGAGFGVGVAGGFRTRWSDAELSTERPAARAFVDYDHGFEDGYLRAVLAAGQEWPDSGGVRTTVALEPSLAWGPARLSAEARAARDPDGGWVLSDLQVAGAVRPVEPLRLSLHYSQGGAAWSWTRWHSSSTRRRIGGGVAWTGAAVSSGVDVALSRTQARDESDDARVGRSAMLWAQLDRGVLHMLPGLSATWWQDDADRAVAQLAPSITVPVGRGRVRAEYRWEHAEMGGPDSAGPLVTHGFGAALSLPVDAYFLQLSGDHRTGGGVSTTRVYTGIEARIQ